MRRRRIARRRPPSRAVAPSMRPRGRSVDGQGEHAWRRRARSATCDGSSELAATNHADASASRDMISRRLQDASTRAEATRRAAAEVDVRSPQRCDAVAPRRSYSANSFTWRTSRWAAALEGGGGGTSSRRTQPRLRHLHRLAKSASPNSPGDSLTRGDGIASAAADEAQHGEVPRQLPLRLATLLGDGFEVRNFGRGGATACNRSDVAVRQDAALSRALRLARPARAVVAPRHPHARHERRQGAAGEQPRLRRRVRRQRGGLAELLARAPAMTLRPPPRRRRPPFDHWGISQRCDCRRSARRARHAVPAAASCAAGGGRLAAPLPIAATRELITFRRHPPARSGTSLLACAAHEALAAFCGADCALLTRPGAPPRARRARAASSRSRARAPTDRAASGCRRFRSTSITG